MKQSITETAKVPEGVTITCQNGTVTAKGSKGELHRIFSYPGMSIKVDGHKLIATCEKGTLREKRMINTAVSHIKNMMHGVKEGYTYELKICSGHFPMTVAADKDKITVKNFLGEKVPRTASIMEGVTVKIEGDKVVVTSTDLEKAGQMATRIEKAMIVKGRDRRIFQDGIFISKKPGM